MKKRMIIFAIGLMLLLVGAFMYMKLTPPLVSGTVASADEKHLVIIGVGNKGFKSIKITDVLVNNNEQPQKLMVQVSNPLKGFIVADPFDEAAKEYGIQKLESVSIQPKTSPQVLFEKMDKGTATEKDISYGITIAQDQPIDTVIIKYKYLGLSFVDTIAVQTE